MANVWNNISAITKPLHECLEAKVVLAKSVDRRYDSSFGQAGAQQGDALTIRYPGLGASGVSGRVANPGSIGEFTRQVSLAQWNFSQAITAKEMTLNVDDFKKQVLDPLAAKVAVKVDSLVSDLFPQITNVIGAPGTAPTTLELFNQAKANMLMHGCLDPMGLKAFLHPSTEVKLIAGMSGLLNSPESISQQYEMGTIGKAAGLAFSSYGLMPVHQTGTFGTSTPLMKGSTLEGATQIVTDGWASGASALKVGDAISIAGVYSVNPLSGASTGELKTFVVTEDASDSSGEMTIKISPAISVSGLDAVSALPANDAAVYVYGANANTYSNKVSKYNLVFHKDALVLASADLAHLPGIDCKTMRGKDLNVPFRLLMDSDGYNDVILLRMDFLAGACLGRHNWASIIAA